jgi:hypothetical protein
MNTQRQLVQRVTAAVNMELAIAAQHEAGGDPVAAFRHLERAHILGQHVTKTHVKVHWHMLLWGWHHRRPSEVTAQVLRVVAAATKTAVGWVPRGNTGGSNVSAVRPMPVPADLQLQLDSFSHGDSSK